MKITIHKLSNILIVIAVLGIIGLPHLLKVIDYVRGPSIQAAMESPTMQSDAHYGFIYKLEYEDKDEEGNTQYHFISTGGENVPKVITAEFEWQDEWSVELMLPVYHPAGWYYYTVNEDEWEIAFIRWIKSPDYDGRELPYGYQEYVPER
ncbi:hypothetical protein [Atopobium fossor]|uniref:hypothetical protein n=1 Tax=Atopobium fossor TaxID=39487 RepID=UPI000487A79B|nr:hypothetical protein [Atopobium fossor]